MKTVLTMIAASAAAALTTPLQAIDFRAVAPQDAATVVVIEDFTTMQAHLDDSGLRDVWDDPRVQEWFDSFTEMVLEEYGEELDALGLDIKDMKMPTGQVGMGMWVDQNDLDEEGMPKPPQVLIVADFGDNAADMFAMLEEAMHTAADDDKVRLEEDDYGDYAIMTVLPVEEEEDEDGEDWEDWDDWDEPAMGGPLASLFPGTDGFEQMHLTFADEVLLVCTSMRGLEDALDRHDGDGPDSLMSSETFLDAHRRVGDADVWFVNTMDEQFEQMLAQDPMIGGMIKDFGLTDIQSLSAGLSMDSDIGMAELLAFLVTEDKQGVLGLLDFEGKPFSPPAFISPDTTELVSAQFSFDRLMDLVKQAMQAAMAEDEMGMAAMMEQQLRMVEPAVRAMGPDVNMQSIIRRPFDGDSEISLTAIRVRDAKTVAAVVDNFGMQIGLQSRDFQGNQIWTMGDGGFFPLQIAIGLGAGHLFVSPSEEMVENALRQAGESDSPALVDDETFKKAVGVLDNRGVLFGYSNVKRQLPYIKWVTENMADMLRQQFMDQMGGEQLQPWQEEMVEDMAAAAKEAPPLDAIFEYIGNMVYEVQSTDEGYAAKAYILAP